MLLSALVPVLLASLQDTPPLPAEFNAEAVVVNAALTPGGETVIALDQEGTLYGWNRQTRKRLYIRRGIPKAGVRRRLVCSQDGRYLAISSRDLPAGVVLILRVSTGEIALHVDTGHSPAFSPDGNYVACSDGRLVRRWSLKSGAELPTLEESPVDLKSVAWSSGSSRIASVAEFSDRVFFWDLPGRKVREWMGVHGDGPVSCLSFAPDGESLAIGTHFGARILCLTPDQVVKQKKCEDYARGDLSYSADGRQLISVDRQRQVLIWNSTTTEVEYLFRIVAESPLTQELSTNGKYLIWMVGSGIRLERIPALLEGSRTGNLVTALGFTEDGKALTGGRNGLVQVWDPETEKEIRRHAVPSRKVSAFANGGRWAVLGGGSGEVLIWDLEAEKEVFKTDPPAFVNQVALSPDVKTLGLALLDGMVSLWDIAAGKETIRIPMDGESVDAIAWSPDGRTLAWGTCKGRVVMADGSTAGDRVTYAGRGAGIVSLDFTRDGKRLAVRNALGEERFYTGEIGRDLERVDWESTIRRIYPDPRWMESIMRKQGYDLRTFSPDGRYALMSSGSTVMIWKAPWEP